MIIAFDGYSAVYENKRSTNYSRHLIDAMSAEYPNDLFYIYSATLIDNNYLTPIITRPHVEVKTQRSGMSTFMWRNFGGILESIKRHHIQVFHGVCGQLPLRIRRGDAASVVTFEDTTFLDQKGISAAWKRFMARKSVKNADAIVVQREIDRKRVVEEMGAPAHLVKMVLPGIPLMYSENVKHSYVKNANDKYKLPERYLVIEGTIDSRSHAMQVLKAIERSGDEDLCLVLLGKGPDDYILELKKWSACHDMMHRLIHIHNVRTAYIPAITSQALLSFSSNHEGKYPYGALHAQVSGSALVAEPQIADVVADGAVLTDLNDIDAIADVIKQYTTDEDARQQLIARGKKNAENHKPENMAHAYHDIYREALKNRLKGSDD